MTVYALHVSKFYGTFALCFVSIISHLPIYNYIYIYRQLWFYFSKLALKIKINSDKPCYMYSLSRALLSGFSKMVINSAIEDSGEHLHSTFASKYVRSPLPRSLPFSSSSSLPSIFVHYKLYFSGFFLFGTFLR